MDVKHITQYVTVRYTSTTKICTNFYLISLTYNLHHADNLEIPFPVLCERFQFQLGLLLWLPSAFWFSLLIVAKNIMKIRDKNTTFQINIHYVNYRKSKEFYSYVFSQH